ncbi:hypothetical protein DYB37_007520 [Aphanomyces astaci]|uniref:Uncharacterized protein n=1 Tax=Aphanomyces astaci TaxID=112090 RepID=A0A397ECR7_APHAT|nr:hypothetical protein DYB34_003316 [Aphanomyces astaci]RHY65679.1 hypothetical protein DYB38_003509 [Aphanomyces astaci]RHY79162.1 hypothetical protein DYB31_008385 [Aphanomyces astaci]RHZ27719.1 hypothetical protein DYB37_007520 [Aphanomyces astaci]
MVDHNVTSATDFHNAPRTPPTTVDPKDSNEYEHGFQRRRHRRIAVITAATCLLVVGAVVGVASLSATNPTEVQSSANSKIDPRNSTNITSVPNVTLNLYRSNAFFTSLAPGGSIQVDGTAQRSQMFYFGWDASGDATLFETHFGADNRFYYDISIIPVRCGASWDVCIGPSSFKLPMTVLVRPASGANLQQFPTCKTLSCGDATCPVAYKVPNDVKTMVCPKQVSMTITAC